MSKHHEKPGSPGDILAHHGVKGMKWGVRKDHPQGVSKHVSKAAEKDAKEFARAKSYFGEGAGTRRKLIKQTVDAKSARVPGYKKAFDHHLSKQDMSKHASKAVKERTSTDRKGRNKQRAGAIARRATGEMGTQAAFVAAAAAGAAYLNSARGRATMNVAAAKIYQGRLAVRRRVDARRIADFLAKQA